MAMTHVELYEALKGQIGQKAARLIAEVFPAAKDLPTKSYVDHKIAELRGEMREGFASLRAEIHAEGKHAMRWMLGLFIPVWAATIATLIVALQKL